MIIGSATLLQFNFIRHGDTMTRRYVHKPGTDTSIFTPTTRQETWSSTLSYSSSWCPKLSVKMYLNQTWLNTKLEQGDYLSLQNILINQQKWFAVIVNWIWHPQPQLLWSSELVPSLLLPVSIFIQRITWCIVYMHQLWLLVCQNWKATEIVWMCQ